jgi:hypothetical protein
LWLEKGVREDMARSKSIDFYALSCGSFRKKAQNLIETAQRKSQDRETTATGIASGGGDAIQALRV